MEALKDEVVRLRELEKTYLKAIKALHLECTRLEKEVSQLRKLKEEVATLRKRELWYVKALRGLNEECNRLEREIYELKKRQNLPLQASVDMEEYPHRVLLELFAFADSGVNLKALKRASRWLGIDYHRAEAEVQKLRGQGVLRIENGYAVVRREVQRQLRDHLLRNLPDRDEIIESLNGDAIGAVELLRCRRGMLAEHKFVRLGAERRAALLKLVEKGLIFRTVDRDGEILYHMPEEILELMDELRVEIAKRTALTREELGSDKLETNKALLEAFRNEQIGPLVKALKSKDVHTRRFAVSALWKIGSRDVVGHLTEMLDDSDTYVRRLTISALMKIGDEQVVEPLIRKLQDEDSMVRYSAVSYFDNHPHPSAFSSLVKALRDEDSMVRTVAASALGKLGMKEAVPHLIEALHDEDTWVRHCAAEALDRIKTG